MVVVWKHGRVGWACERCRTVIGEWIDHPSQEPQDDTPGHWRESLDLLRRARNL